MIAWISQHSAKVLGLQQRLTDFMAEHGYPNERLYFEQAQAAGPFGYPAFIDELKPLARAAGLWNLFLPPGRRGRRARYRAPSEFPT